MHVRSLLVAPPPPPLCPAPAPASNPLSFPTSTGGETLQEAFENVGLCMFNYMTPLEGLAPGETRTLSAEGHDLPSLLYHWLDELLFAFSTDFFVPCSLKITKFDREAWKIEAEG